MTYFRSSIQDWHKRWAHQPWFRRYEWLFMGLVGWLAFAMLVLPPFGSPDPLGAATVISWYLAGFTMAGILLTDREKPTLLKRAASLSVVALFFWLFYYYSGTRWDRVHEQFFNFSRMDGVWELYAQGLLVTLQVSIVSAVLSIIFGLTFGILRTRGNPVLDLFLGLHVDIFRALPLIVSMVLIFYALPFLGIRLPAFWAAVLALVLMNSAYQTEIFRAGIESIPRGQLDAARALGLGTGATLRHVILPQAFKIVIPPLTNNLVSLVKDTAVAYVITVPELLTTAQQAVTWKRTPTPLVLSMFVYLLTLIPLIHLTRRLERRLNVGNVR
ncbi:amine acid ABC transporter, permease protein, 3-TM region, His/Glu/Gln/Arg/opine family [Jannaschia faecimaris]|uniref:Amine acid ABC transporter, permease protein, 3-TM region, His/Glu/Gln/Arg/opine family n=1 Tax=Jannaschia faecimaris TaxID=1244108 RepID=A0A1H3UIB0_9RHOB|nr:amino acid ABC transporter permease [Jannaschia faecimaris]SDZ62222.1 amine acid ABC transporter, permease protein, 3-TM region, His/Glu/Gln/Arg/opine family [Jannaschia faecimaris]